MCLNDFPENILRKSVYVGEREISKVNILREDQILFAKNNILINPFDVLYKMKSYIRYF